jgi:hypothetical protein
MEYKANLRYGAKVAGETFMSRKVVVNSFEVVGASRTVNLNSSDDISIYSLLNRARSLKNLTVYLPQKKDGADMEVVMELSGFFNSKDPLIVEVSIEKHSNGNMIEGIVLLDQAAKLQFSPLIIRKQLAVAITLPAAGIWSGKYAQ